MQFGAVRIAPLAQKRVNRLPETVQECRSSRGRRTAIGFGLDLALHQRLPSITMATVIAASDDMKPMKAVLKDGAFCDGAS
jgi:hypothetical protein